MEILKAKNIKKYYKIKKNFYKKIIKAVDDVSFSVKEKSIFGIAGESGSGKTTLAKLISMLIFPDAGDIYFKDINLNKLENKKLRLIRKDLQIVFQDPFNSLDSRFNVFKIITEGLDNFFKYNFKEKLDICKKILKDVGLSTDVLFFYPHQFSGGERQRINIARSLVIRPELIILDEPISSLDVSIQAQIINLLLDLHKKFGLTYIFISHDLNILRYICDEIAIMYLGKIVEISKTEEIFKNPLHPYTKLLIASIPSLDKKLDINEFEFDNQKGECVFFNRCKFRKDICKNNTPQLIEVSLGHFVSCFLIS